MPNQTNKSHKPRKTGAVPAKPRQRKSSTEQSSAVSPSSDAPMVTAPVSPVDLTEKPKEGANEPKVGTEAVVVLPLVELPREKQPWYRPADSKLRKKSSQIALLRASGRDAQYIAKKLNTTDGTVRHIMYIARKNGWLDDQDEPVDIEAELAHNIDRKVVRNISASLDGGMTNWQTHEMTIAAAKGRGMFKSHDKSEGGPVLMQPVAIQIVMPALGAEQQVVIEEDNIGGVPAYEEGEVFEGEENLLATPDPIRPEFAWLFKFFADDDIGIAGSALRDFDAAKDVDVLFPASVDFRKLADRLHIPYRGGWDTPRGRIHVLNLGMVPAVKKPVQLIQCSATAQLSDHPHAVLLRDGTLLHAGVFHDKS